MWVQVWPALENAIAARSLEIAARSLARACLDPGSFMFRESR